MTATFTTSLPTAKDRLRFRLGDTDTTAALIQDETYAGALAYYGTEPLTLSALAKGLIARFGQKPTRAQLGDGVGFEWGERIGVWRELVREAEGGSSSFVLARSSDEGTEYTATWVL